MTAKTDPTAAIATLRKETKTVLERHVEAGGEVHMDGSRSHTYCLQCNRGWPCAAHSQATRFLTLLGAVEETRERLTNTKDEHVQGIRLARTLSSIKVIDAALAAILEQEPTND